MRDPERLGQMLSNRLYAETFRGVVARREEMDASFPSDVNSRFGGLAGDICLPKWPRAQFGDSPTVTHLSNDGSGLVGVLGVRIAFASSMSLL